MRIIELDATKWLGSGRGEGRLVIDNASGARYYTNNYYYSFYAIQMNQIAE
jgi:hypothetical protein